MFLFQGIHEKALQELSANRQSAPSRLLPEEHLHGTTFEGAYQKLATAKRVQESVYGLFDYLSGMARRDRGKKPWNEAACLRVLEDMGYESPKQAFISFQLSNFENDLQMGGQVIGDLQRIYNATENAALRHDLAKAANAQASIFLARNSKYVLWAAHDWAQKGNARMQAFFELVDANTYLASTNIGNLYFAGGQIGGKFRHLAEPNSSLNRAYLSILPSSLRVDFQAKSNVRLVEEYSARISNFNESYQKYSAVSMENFARQTQIAKASTWHEKAYLISAPYAEAAMPVVMALAMLEPAAAPMGYMYFANAAKKSFKEGRVVEGTLIALTLSAPLFSFMRGFGGAVGKAGFMGSAASHAAGTVFQLQIGASTIPLVIDGAKYGMGDAELAQLGANAGFLAMPIAARKPQRQANKHEKIIRQAQKDGNFERQTDPERIALGNLSKISEIELLLNQWRHAVGRSSKIPDYVANFLPQFLTDIEISEAAKDRATNRFLSMFEPHEQQRVLGKIIKAWDIASLIYGGYEHGQAFFHNYLELAKKPVGAKSAEKMLDTFLEKYGSLTAPKVVRAETAKLEFAPLIQLCLEIPKGEDIVAKDRALSMLSREYLGPVLWNLLERFKPEALASNFNPRKPPQGLPVQKFIWAAVNSFQSGMYGSGSNAYFFTSSKPLIEKIKTNVHELHHYVSFLGGGSRLGLDVFLRSAKPVKKLFDAGCEKAINEGITELYSQRLSIKNGVISEPVSYPNETAGMYMVEQIVGEKTMRDAYFFGKWAPVMGKLDSVLGKGSFAMFFRQSNFNIVIYGLMKRCAKRGMALEHLDDHLSGLKSKYSEGNR